MSYSAITITLVQIIFFSSVIVGSFLIWRKSAIDEEHGSLIKLIGFTLLSAFKFNINSIPIPAGLLLAYFIFAKVIKNKVAKKNAILLGATLFLIWLYPFQNNIEQAFYPRDDIKTYLSEKIEPEKKGFIFTFVDMESNLIYASYVEKDERGIQIYRSLAQSQILDHIPQSSDWKYGLQLSQDTDNDRFTQLRFHITEDGQLILLTFEEKQYYFQGTSEFQSLVSEMSKEFNQKQNY